MCDPDRRPHWRGVAMGRKKRPKVHSLSMLAGVIRSSQLVLRAALLAAVQGMLT
jgi:hypothetical protein